MKITRITKENEKAFEGFFSPMTAGSAPNRIRLGAVDDEGTAAGALGARISESGTEIYSLFVVENRRRQGYAQAMLKILTKIVEDSAFDTLTSSFLQDDASVSFFLAQGFELFPGKEQYSFSLGELLRSPLYKKYITGKKVSPAPPISDIGSSQKRLVDLKAKGVDYDPKWSTAHFASGDVQSMLLATCRGESICIVWMESEGGDPMELMQDMSGLVKLALERFGLNKDVTFRMVFEDEKLSDNMAALMGGACHLHRDGRYLNAVKISR